MNPSPLSQARGDLLRLLHRAAGRARPHTEKLAQLLSHDDPEHVRQGLDLVATLDDPSIDLALLEGLTLDRAGQLQSPPEALLGGPFLGPIFLTLLARRGGPGLARLESLAIDPGPPGWPLPLDGFTGLHTLTLQRGFHREERPTLTLPPLPRLRRLVLRGLRLRQWPRGLTALPALRDLDLSAHWSLVTDSAPALPQVTRIRLLGMSPAIALAARAQNPSARIDCSGSDDAAELVELIEAGIHISGLPRLDSCTIEQAHILARALPGLGGELRLKGDAIEAPVWRILVAAPELQQLRVKGKLTDKGCTLEAVHPGLTTLDLSRAGLSPAQFRGLGRLRALRDLRLGGPSEVGPAVIEALPAMTALDRLELRGLGLTEDVLPLVARLPRLRHLDLRNNLWIDGSRLGALDGHPTLAHIELDWNQLTADALRGLAQARALAPLVPAARHENANQLTLDDAGAPWLAGALPRFSLPDERVLMVQGARLSRTGLAALPRRGGWRLDLSENPDLGEPDLSLLRHLGADSIRLPHAWDPLPIGPLDLPLTHRLELLRQHLIVAPELSSAQRAALHRDHGVRFAAR